MIVAMTSLRPLDITGCSVIQETTPNDAVFPVITRKDKNKRRVLVSRSVSVNNHPNVPAPGHEYDFRRTPDLGRTTPRRGFHGQIRPCIPPDTADLEALRLNVDDQSPPPVTYRSRRVERLDVARCPTPMPPPEENWPNGGQQYKTIETARSAWTSGPTNITTIATDGGDTPHDPPGRIPANSRPSSKHVRTIPDANKETAYTDLESECVTPTPSFPLDLTADVLNYYYQRPVDKDRRIVRWIADCEEKSRHLLPAHLPNIAMKPSPTVSFEEL